MIMEHNINCKNVSVDNTCMWYIRYIGYQYQLAWFENGLRRVIFICMC